MRGDETVRSGKSVEVRSSGRIDFQTSRSGVRLVDALRRGAGRREAEESSLGLLVRGVVGDGETIPGSCFREVPSRLAVHGKPAADDRPGFAIGGKVRQVVAEHALGFGATGVRPAASRSPTILSAWASP